MKINKFQGFNRAKEALLKRAENQSYFKFMVARHPFYRLTSGYEDKFSTVNKSAFHLKYWGEHHGNEIKFRVTFNTYNN